MQRELAAREMLDAAMMPREVAHGEGQKQGLRGAFWKLDTPEAHRLVEQEVSNVLERVCTKVNKLAEDEAKKKALAEERERERRESARRREEVKRQREVEKEVLHVIEKIVRRLERADDREESGQPYVYHPPAQKDKAQPKSSSSALLYKVHGAPCLEYLSSAPPQSTARNQKMEDAIRAARQLEALTVQPNAVPRAPKPAKLMWVSPETRGRDWNVICLQRG